jgi:hypothetical protein
MDGMTDQPIEDDDHHVPAELLELYEVLEWAGEIQPAEEPLLLITPSTATQAPVARFVSRAAWGARRPKYGYSSIRETAQGNTAHYEGPRMGAFPHTSCATKVRGIQNFHMDSRGWNDVAYNSIVCPHGYIYECRWYGARGGANGTSTGNKLSYAHCALIGEGDLVTADLKMGMTNVRRYFESLGSGTKQWGHRDWKATACPGEPLYDWVKSGWGFNTPTPTPPTKSQEDDDVIAEIIRTMYKLARSETKDFEYEVAVEDPRGYLTWLGKAGRDPQPIDMLNGQLRPALIREAERAGRTVDIPIV